uniref:Putative secreted protein n=1 Tax=Psorophora albipes TaxID=869069 RepID=T1E3G7_9DIPT
MKRIKSSFLFSFLRYLFFFVFMSVCTPYIISRVWKCMQNLATRLLFLNDKLHAKHDKSVFFSYWESGKSRQNKKKVQH